MTYKRFCNKYRIDPAASSSRARYISFVESIDDAVILDETKYIDTDRPLQWRDLDDTTTRDAIENFLLIFFVLLILAALIYDKCN